MSQPGDEFELYDLTVVVEAIEGTCTCAMRVGDCFYLRGGKLSMPAGADFCLYALQSTLPLLPAKQRHNHPADWMETDARVTFHVIEAPDAAAAIVEYARKNQVDQIVMGARSSSMLRRYLGSVSARVVAESDCTVTVVRAADAPR